MKLNNLQDLYVDQLKDIYSAERQLEKALPKMAKAAQAPDVRQAFEQHLEQTKRQLDRLQQVFDKVGANPGRKKCVGMEGLIKETEEFLSQSVSPAVMDAGLIANAQRAEHYEIAAYGTVRTFANMMGQKEAATLLQQTLDEEAQTDKMLTSLAERYANPRAEQLTTAQPRRRVQSGGTSRISR